ncbi:MAG: c-type cytochrome [Nitrospiria bacterium]
MDKKKEMHPGIRVGLWVVAVYLVLKFAVRPPLPSSVIFMYMLLVAIGAVVYLNLFYSLGGTVVTPLFNFLGGGVEGGVAKGSRYAVLVVLPVVFWFGMFQKLDKELVPPPDTRVIHPAPPVEFTGLYNPFRVEDEEELRANIAEGREIYFKNCFFCHGDSLEGDGIFAHGLNPQPANFQDSTTISMLQESFVFWRVSTGGPGLPDESTPWNSAMPQWEKMLTEEERWKAILFIYDYTGWKPRTWE